jgi:predicted membrane channel-forming protein YqfA (hemolysin III family)
MKKFGIIVAILGIALLTISSFFYKKTINAVDTGGSSEIVTGPNGGWTFKLPMFAGGALFIIGLVFYAAAYTDNQKHTHAV